MKVAFLLAMIAALVAMATLLGLSRSARFQARVTRRSTLTIAGVIVVLGAGAAAGWALS